jgi:hypothetical protein
MRRALPLLFAALLLTGFTGDKGAESEVYVGGGIGRISTPFDADNYGEIGGTWRHKFRNFPYDDLAGWFQIGASWSTYPTGGNLGNQLLTIQLMGGTVKNYGEFGAGFVLTGDLTGVGPMLLLPSFRLRLGDHDKAQFGFGMFDEAPYWSGGGLLHFEGIFAVPFEKIWAPRLKIGGRMNAYGAGERFPLELYGGAEAHLGRHVRLGIEGSLGDGGVPGGEPSFTAAVKVGGAFGKGTKSGVRPTPAR